MLERNSEIESWIRKGDHDLGTAKITYLHIPEFLDTVTFHCQQAVEKYLKAYLIFQSTAFRFSHDLIYLMDLISQNDIDFEKYYDVLSELQGYAVEIRYSNQINFISPDKVENALSIAKEVREFVTMKMNIAVDYHTVIDK